MQARIYRFEIVRALANAAYEVRDPASGALLTLYEWTPAPPDREPAKRRLSELADGLPFEVFTADASLYLAAGSRGQASDGLKALQAHGLFTGVWWEAVQPPPVPVPPRQPVQPPHVVPLTRAKGKGKGLGLRGWLGIAAGLAMFALGYWFATPGQTRSPAPAAVQDAASGESQRTRQRIEQAEKLAAVRARELNSYAGINTLRMKNSGSYTYQVAVACLGFNGLSVVQGWTTIPAGKTSLVAVSPGNVFFYYAKRADGVAVPGSAKPFGVEDGDFVYYAGQMLPGLTPVSPRQASPGVVELR